MKYHVSCEIALLKERIHDRAHVLRSLARLGLQAAPACPGAEANELKLQVVGQFEVSERALSMESRGRKFLQTCISLKVSEKLADLNRPGVLEHVRVSE